MYPNLEFRTVGDDRVRPAHRELHGIIKPIDDVFWTKYYPPLDWRCRCDAVPTAENPKGEVPKDMHPPKFVGNVGIDKEIFQSNHNFFRLINEDKEALRNRELMKLNAPYEVAYKSKLGKKVEVSIFADKKELEANLNTAIVVVDNLNINVKIRPHLDTNRAIGFKNAEYYINGNLSDLKSKFKENNYKAINNAFKEAKSQGLNSIVFDFTNSFKKLDITEINRWVLSNINENRGKQYSEIIFVYHNKAIRVAREVIIERKLLKELEKLKANS